MDGAVRTAAVNDIVGRDSIPYEDHVSRLRWNGTQAHFLGVDHRFSAPFPQDRFFGPRCGDEHLMEGLTALEPFGPGNRRPVFHADPVQIVDGPHTVKEHHLRMTVKQGRRRFRAMAWRAADREAFFAERRDALNLAFSLTENTFRGETFIELNVADVK